MLRPGRTRTELKSCGRVRLEEWYEDGQTTYHVFRNGHHVFLDWEMAEIAYNILAAEENHEDTR